MRKLTLGPFLKLSRPLLSPHHGLFRFCPSSSDPQAKVCELWVSARSLSGADHLPVLRGSGHHARHLQSRRLCVAHVPCVCVVWVRTALSPPPNPLQMGVTMLWFKVQVQQKPMVLLDFCPAGCCWDAAWFLSLWTTSRTPITFARAANACSTSTGKLAVDDTAPQSQRFLSTKKKKSCSFKWTFALNACTFCLRFTRVRHVQDVSI